jgi:hypothetical protein
MLLKKHSGNNDDGREWHVSLLWQCVCRRQLLGRGWLQLRGIFRPTWAEQISRFYLIDYMMAMTNEKQFIIYMMSMGTEVWQIRTRSGNGCSGSDPGVKNWRGSRIAAVAVLYGKILPCFKPHSSSLIYSFLGDPGLNSFSQSELWFRSSKFWQFYS